MMRIQANLVTDLTNMTDAQLEREFWTESLQPVAGKESGHHGDNSQSADRPKSSDSKTSSGQSDQVIEHF